MGPQSFISFECGRITSVVDGEIDEIFSVHNNIIKCLKSPEIRVGVLGGYL